MQMVRAWAIFNLALKTAGLAMENRLSFPGPYMAAAKEVGAMAKELTDFIEALMGPWSEAFTVDTRSAQCSYSALQLGRQ